MPHPEGVVFAFLPFGEAGQPFILPQRGKCFFAAGEDFMDIGLVSYIKDKFVFRGVKDPVQRQRQLHHPQVGGQVAAVFGHHINEQLPDLRRQPVHFFRCESFQVQRTVDSVQNFIFRHCVQPFRYSFV